MADHSEQNLLHSLADGAERAISIYKTLQNFVGSAHREETSH